jgi:hypothetical protein
MDFVGLVNYKKFKKGQVKIESFCQKEKNKKKIKERKET